MKLLETAFRLTLIILIFNSLCCEGFAQDQVRLWTSRDANETIEASFQSYDPKTRQVSLQLRDGEFLVLHLQQLSRADHRYVTKVARKRLQKPQTESDNAVMGGKPETRKNARKTSSNTRTAYGIHWTPDIQSALKSATGGESLEDDRPIMWLRVLGDLSGFM